MNKSKQQYNRTNNKLKSQVLTVLDSHLLNQDMIPHPQDARKFNPHLLREWTAENQRVGNKCTDIQFIIQLLTK